MSTIIAKLDRSKYKTELSNGSHVLIGDEPKPIGTDEGPTPYDYLLMALGSCTAMTLRMYADRKNWELDEVEVRLTQERTHVKDCDDCESTEGFVHLIEKEIILTGNLDREQRMRLMEISERCPVHKTMENEIKISMKKY